MALGAPGAPSLSCVHNNPGAAVVVRFKGLSLSPKLLLCDTKVTISWIDALSCAMELV
jgi:hypothetical protein